MDLESSNCTLEEKLSKAHNVLTSTQALTPQIIQEIFLWFLNRKEEMIRKRNSSKNNLELLYQHLHKCLKTHQMSHVSIHQIKYNIIENLLELLNVKKNSTSIETYLQCCISMLNIDNFVKCLEGNATLFTKFATYTSWVFSTSENDSENTKPDHLDIIFKLMEKIVTISKKIKWNLDLSVPEMTDALVFVATLDHWCKTWQKDSDQINLILEQVFFSVVTKDGSLCGILLTSFHDESILINPEYSNIFNLISLLQDIPTQQKAHITGTIYTLLLKTTYKLSEDYFGKVSFVFAKLDSYIRNKITDYEGKDLKVTPIIELNPLEHWMKLVYIYKYLSEFLVKQNISTSLPVKNSSEENGETLEDLCTQVSICIMYVLSNVNINKKITKQIITDCYSVLLFMFSFDPYIALKTFPHFKRLIICTQSNSEREEAAAGYKMYGQVFGTILKIHFKLSKEIVFLETLFRSADFPKKCSGDSACWLPQNSLKSALHQVFSTLSSERILSGWLSGIVAHFNVKSFERELKLNNYYLSFVCTTLVCSLEVTILNKTSISNDSLIATRRTQLMNEVKNTLGNMNSLLRLHKQNVVLYSCFLEVATYWGLFSIMCDKYNASDCVHEDLSKLRAEDHALYLFHNYLDIESWRRITKLITTHHKNNSHVMNALCDLLAQSLDMLHSYVNIDSKHSPAEVTSKFLVEQSDLSFILSRAHLIQPNLSIKDQWKLAKKLSLHLISTEDAQSLLSTNVNLHEVNVLVFGVAFHVLREALVKINSRAVDILNFHEEEILKLAINEDKKSFLRNLLKKTQDSSDERLDKSSDGSIASHSEESNSESDNEGEGKEEQQNDDSEDELSDNESKTKRKSAKKKHVKEEAEDTDFESSGLAKKRKLGKEDLNSLLVELLNSDDSTDSPNTDLMNYLSIIEHLPVQYLEPSSQTLLFLLVLLCFRSFRKIEPLLNCFLLCKNFSIPHCDSIPFLLRCIQDTNGDNNEVATKLFKLSVKDENAIKVISKYFELTKKKVEDINVDLCRTQCNLTYYFLNEMKCSKTSNKNINILKKKIISRTHKNFKSLHLEPSQATLSLFGFMLQKSLKEHDCQGIEDLCTNFNSYLDLALEQENKDLIKMTLTYADLSLKKYIPPDFTQRVCQKLPSCANLCFQAATLTQFNEFLDQMFNELNEILKGDGTDSCNVSSLESNFELWRQLVTSHLSRNTNTARLTKLEAVIACLSVHVSLYTGENTRHFPLLLQLVLDIVYSPAFSSGNTSIVHFLFNLITPKSRVYFKPCMKLLQYLITKKASIITDETALFLLKYHSLLSQIVQYVCREDSADRDSLLLGMGKIALAVRKEKKYFQRVAPYALANFMQLSLTHAHKLPVDAAVHLNEISHTFISLCDEHGLHYLKHSLPDSCKQVFLQTLQNYTKYHSQRFV